MKLKSIYDFAKKINLCCPKCKMNHIIGSRRGSNYPYIGRCGVKYDIISGRYGLLGEITYIDVYHYFKYKTIKHTKITYFNW